MADRDFAQLQTTARPPKGVGVPRLRVGLLVVAIVAIVIAGFVGGFQMGRRQGHETAQNEARSELVAQIRAQQRELQLLRQQQAADKAKAAAGNTQANADVGDLTFYTDLPKQSVKPEPLSQPVSKPGMVPPAPQPATAAAPAASTPAPAAPVPAAPAPAAKPASPQPAASAPDNQMVHAVIQHELAGQPAPAAKDAFYVQVASFRDAQEAGRMRRRLKAIGLDSRLKHVTIPGRGDWYRLQAGPYGSRHDAESVHADIDQKLHIKGIIVHGGG